jgi:uncharacterized protein YjbI with pentapeptide repeats
VASKTTRLQAPRIERPRLARLGDGDAAALAVDADVVGERFTGIDASERDLSGAKFGECEFVDVSLDDASLRGARFFDSTLSGMNAPVLRASRSSWRDVVIERSRIGSGELYDASLQSVHFSHCKIGYLNLRGAVLRDILFTDCAIDELDVGGATITRLAFADTSVRMLDVTRATLEHADLRGADLRGVRGVDSLRGATVTELQLAELATLLAAQLGIEVQP